MRSPDPVSGVDVVEDNRIGSFHESILRHHDIMLHWDGIVFPLAMPFSATS
jgi:hypothetical protein